MCTIIIYTGPHLACVVLLNAEDVVFVMVVDVEIGQVETPVLEHNEYLVFAVELAKELSLSVVVEAFDVAVEPNLAATQSAAAMALERHLADLNLGQDVASAASALDGYLTEILVEEDLLQFRIGLENDLNHFCLRSRRCTLLPGLQRQLPR